MHVIVFYSIMLSFTIIVSLSDFYSRIEMHIFCMWIRFVSEETYGKKFYVRTYF